MGICSCGGGYFKPCLNAGLIEPVPNVMLEPKLTEVFLSNVEKARHDYATTISRFTNDLMPNYVELGEPRRSSRELACPGFVCGCGRFGEGRPVDPSMAA